jgi:hypothetical protein
MNRRFLLAKALLANSARSEPPFLNLSRRDAQDVSTSFQATRALRTRNSIAKSRGKIEGKDG